MALSCIAGVVESADRQSACNTLPALTTQHVGDAGMAKPILSLIQHLESKSIPEPNSGCWIWLGAPTPKGYGQYRKKGQKPQQAHRASWTVYNGPIPEGMQVCHKCDVPSCINPAHLFLGTPADNSADMVRKGRSSKQRGMAASRARLTDQEVLAIRSSKETPSALASKYGISRCHVSNIRRRYCWRHLP